VGPRAGLSTIEKRKILFLPGIEPWPSSPYCILAQVSQLLAGTNLLLNLIPHIVTIFENEYTVFTVLIECIAYACLFTNPNVLSILSNLVLYKICS
jgi:hypothetical protein